MAGFASGSSGQKLTKRILLERNENLNSAADSYIAELESVQQVIDTLDTDLNEKKAKILMSYERSKKPIFDRRNDLAKNIPNFWIRSFEKHPDIGSLIDGETGECLRYLSRLDVLCVDETTSKFTFKLNFHFNDNPYFENDVLTKEVVINDDDTVTSTNSTINWKPKKRIRSKTTIATSSSRKRKWEPRTFFEWFESNPRRDSFADYFRDLHHQPLRYFYGTYDDESDSYYDDDETDCSEDTTEEGMDT